MNSPLTSPLNADLHYSNPFNPTELRAGALDCLIQTESAMKVAGIQALASEWHAGRLVLRSSAALSSDAATIPGRPARPELVSPLLVKHRSMRTEEGRATMIHALAHIEFNAINLALDVIWRFPDMPEAFYVDWLLVASEEAYHFSLLAAHLQVLGYAYGDFPAHNSLWDMAEKTRSDILARIALVPRTMEARGLDAAPPVRNKLAQAGDQAAAEILDIIMRDEIGHVAIGNRWYGWLCKQRDLDPIATFANLSVEFKAPVMRGPFNMKARRAAGFTDEELALME
ncbi:ferritin-like domain-containing protein [Herbaspirillum rhizosphaerae]|uniref:Ferritin-like domain-containing protein n=1 Tax=Herbaspirillum rhizosphaerae TaxID=346179 RepID=A0ABW8Z842_9BURK